MDLLFWLTNLPSTVLTGLSIVFLTYMFYQLWLWNIGWIRLCSHCCRRCHFIFVYVQWTMKIKWYPLQQWLHKRIHPLTASETKTED